MKFTAFVDTVLQGVIRLTPEWRVLLLVSLDGVDPCDLSDRDREIARTLFGDVDTIPPSVRRLLVWSLGRGSGKTTIGAAIGLWLMCHGDASSCGPGSVATFVVVAPRLSNARQSVRMARAMVRRVPSLARCVVKGEDSKDGFQLKRPDGTVVAFAAFAASRGGVTGRGFDVLGYLLDEAELFLSGSDFAVTDKDVHAALIPRLLPGGVGIFSSTPWPTSTLMGELVEKNQDAPSTALVAVGPTLVMRSDRPDLVATVTAERERDPENAAREFDCDRSAMGTSAFFDALALKAAIDDSLTLPQAPEGKHGIGAGVDVGLIRDSAAFVGVQRVAKKTRLLVIDELRPKKGAPLKPSAVGKHFATLAEGIGAKAFAADVHYRESLRESAPPGMSITDAPTTTQGKLDTFLELRRQIQEGELSLPSPRAGGARLHAQLASIVTKALPGGGIQVYAPRRAGMGHGDVVHAFALAVWEAGSGSSGILLPSLPPDAENFRPDAKEWGW